MKYRRIGMMTLALGLSLSAASRADIRPPGVEPVEAESTNVYSFTVKVDPEARIARLQVPDTLAASAPAAPGPDGQSRAAPARTRTMIAGLAMSLALASLVLVRRSSRSKQILAGLVVAACSLGAIGIAWGDVRGPEPRPRPPIRPNPDAQIRVEVVAGAENVTLIVPKGMLERLAKTAGAPENRPRDR